MVRTCYLTRSVIKKFEMSLIIFPTKEELIKEDLLAKKTPSFGKPSSHWMFFIPDRMHCLIKDQCDSLRVSIFQVFTEKS